jgi:tRNA-intron lyase
MSNENTNSTTSSCMRKIDIFSLSDHHQIECQLGDKQEQEEANENTNRKTTTQLTSEALSNKAYLVFDFEQAQLLRSSQFRVWGNFIGSQVNALAVDQKTVRTVPLQLSTQELVLLVENFAQQVELLHTKCVDLSQKIGDEVNLERLRRDYDDYVRRLDEKQREDFFRTRLSNMLQMKPKIIEGKRKKLVNELDSLEKKLNASQVEAEEKNKLNGLKDVAMKRMDNLEAEFDAELKQMQMNLVAKSRDELTNEYECVETFVKTPEFYQTLWPILRLDKERLLNESMYFTRRECKYLAFKHLWSLGYYLTCGAKFGGDYLVYPSTPNDYHSQFILVCLEDSDNSLKSIKGKELITYARMATSVKKTFVLAYTRTWPSEQIDADQQAKRSDKHEFAVRMSVQDEQIDLILISINWSHI